MTDWIAIADTPPPEGDEDIGPFFDVTWAGGQHRYLPVPRREIDCYYERGVVKRQHGYPSVTTIYNPQPTHWRPIPVPRREIDCYYERGVVKRQHGYPSVTTIYNPQPTHWRPIPEPAA